MHIEFLVEDLSGEKLLNALLPKILCRQAEPHSWRVHGYKGIGRIPKGLAKSGDPSKRILLDQLPRLLRGYALTPNIDAVVIVLDADRRECGAFLNELKGIASKCIPARQTLSRTPAPKTLFRLAIEEMEAWYFGDRDALLKAYPRARREVLDRYKQDAVCDTWEMLADAIYPGGMATIRKTGWPLPGQVKSEWAERIGPLLDLEKNVSPSFNKLRDGVRGLVASQNPH